MKGTNFPATDEMRSMPPKRTAPTKSTSTTPVTHSGMAKLTFNALAMELACTIFPMPNPAIPANRAKHIASHFQFAPSPFWM